MALIIYWYGLICFGIVGVSFLASLWFIWRNESTNTRKDGNTACGSLLVSSQDADGYVADGYVEAMQRNHVCCFQLWTSCWKGVNPGLLMATRLASFLVMACFLLWDIMDWGLSVLMYYTGWTFSLVMIYFAIATLMSAYGCWISSMPTLVEDDEFGIINSISYTRKEIKCTMKLQTQNAEEAFRLKVEFLGHLMQALYQTCGGAVLLSDLSFWCIIVPFGSKEQLGLNTLMGCMHALNGVFLLLDTTLNSMPFPRFRIAYFVIWGCIYCIFQWVIHACGFTWWPYPFLELDHPCAPCWYLALVLLHIPFYGIYAVIVKAKNSLFSKWFPKVFMRSYY